MLIENEKLELIKAYNKGAVAYAKKFNDIGPRAIDIKRAFSHVQKKGGKVFEIGCGNGRDAKEMMKYTDDYLGVDISREMIKLAKNHCPDADFRVSDIDDFLLPKDLDIIFAFASLLHFDKNGIRTFLKKAHKVLSKKGIVYISLKCDKYQKKVKSDEFGERFFYFYTLEDAREFVGHFYNIVWNDTQIIKGVKWLTVVLQKQ